MKRKKQAAPVREKHVSEKTRAEVLADIKQLEQAGAPNELGDYFIQLAKWGNQPQQYENLFSSYLASPEPYLREAAVFCLLFALQLQKPEYRAVALAMLTDQAEDEDARRWAAAGLAVTYQGTKDRELLQAFFTQLDDAGEDRSLKSSMISNILLLWGLSSREQVLRAGSQAGLKTLLQEFQQELMEVKEWLVT